MVQNRLKTVAYLKALSCFEESWQLTVLDVDLSFVHEVDKGPQLFEAHVFEDHYGMARRVVHE